MPTQPIELRKQRRRFDAPPVDEEPKSLYSVLPQKNASVDGFMGSQHGYEVDPKRKLDVASEEVETDKNGKKQKRDDSKYKDFKF